MAPVIHVGSCQCRAGQFCERFPNAEVHFSGDELAGPISWLAGTDLGSRSDAGGHAPTRNAGHFKHRVSNKPSTSSREQRDADVPVKDDLLTVNEAAAYLTIKPWTLRHWISDRKVDIVKYGNGIVRIRRSVLDRYVASCTIKARVSHGRNTKEPRLPEGAGVEPGAKSLAR